MADISGPGDNIRDRATPPPVENLNFATIGEPIRISEKINDNAARILPPLDTGFVKWTPDAQLKNQAQQFAGSFASTSRDMPRFIR